MTEQYIAIQLGIGEGAVIKYLHSTKRPNPIRLRKLETNRLKLINML